MSLNLYFLGTSFFSTPHIKLHTLYVLDSLFAVSSFRFHTISYSFPSIFSLSFPTFSSFYDKSFELQHNVCRTDIINKLITSRSLIKRYNMIHSDRHFAAPYNYDSPVESIIYVIVMLENSLLLNRDIISTILL